MLDEWLEMLKNGRILAEKDLKQLCGKFKEIAIEESNVQPVHAPVVICGDVHGQFYDLLELFKTGGELPVSNYVFLGDYVDRGYNSVETLEYLLCLKVKFPSKIILLRGNHESRQITSIYGFYDEIIRKYGNPIAWKYCMEVFDYMGVTVLIEGNMLCIHGGLSPDLRTLDEIKMIDRRIEIPSSGPFCDLFWSDPEESIEDWNMNPRGAGWLFGDRVTMEFNHINDLEIIARAHQLVQEGYKYSFKNKSLVTIWSAPNYCYRCGNVGAILSINETLERKFNVFASVSDSSKVVPYKALVPYFL